MNEHELVVLTRTIPEHGLVAGDVGTIVQVYSDGSGFEVEFVAGSGATVAVLTLNAQDIRTFGSTEILHTRTVAA